MGKGLGHRAAAWCVHTGLYIRAFIKWLLLAAVMGTCCGVVGSLFHIGVYKATALRGEHPWLLWCLPLAGLVIVGFYKLTGRKDRAPTTSSRRSTMVRCFPSGCCRPSLSVRC